MSVCPLRVACSLPVATSHSLIVLSLLPEASVLPSGLNATDETRPPCPLRVIQGRSWANSDADATSHRPMAPTHTTTRCIRHKFGFIVPLR